MFDPLFNPPAIISEARKEELELNFRAAQRMFAMDSIVDWLDADPKRRFELGGSVEYALPATVGIDAWTPIDSVEDE